MNVVRTESGNKSKGALGNAWLPLCGGGGLVACASAASAPVIGRAFCAELGSIGTMAAAMAAGVTWISGRLLLASVFACGQSLLDHGQSWQRAVATSVRVGVPGLVARAVSVAILWGRATDSALSVDDLAVSYGLDLIVGGVGTRTQAVA